MAGSCLVSWCLDLLLCAFLAVCIWKTLADYNYVDCFMSRSAFERMHPGFDGWRPDFWRGGRTFGLLSGQMFRIYTHLLLFGVFLGGIQAVVPCMQRIRRVE